MFDFNPLSATGTALLLTGDPVAVWPCGCGRARSARMFLGTLHRVRFSLLTIAAMLAIGYVTPATPAWTRRMGVAFAEQGVLYPFFAAMLGWLGVALTGSDTRATPCSATSRRSPPPSPLQPIPAWRRGRTVRRGDGQDDRRPEHRRGRGVATGQEGSEGNILRYVFFHSIALACLVGLLVLAQAYVFPGVVP